MVLGGGFLRKALSTRINGILLNSNGRRRFYFLSQTDVINIAVVAASPDVCKKVVNFVVYLYRLDVIIPKANTIVR